MSNYDLSAWPLFRSVISENQDESGKTGTCFVIAPFDDEREEVRHHVEMVWKYLARPSFIDSPLAIRRRNPDNPEMCGDKSTYAAILEADLIIAVLNHRNAEVYYQTAIAQASGRPMIVMVQSGQASTLDPRGAPVVEYTLATDAVLESVHIRQLQAAHALYSSADPPRLHGIQPAANHAPVASGPQSLEGFGLIDQSQQVTFERRLAMLREAEGRIDIMGLANLGLIQNPDIANFLRTYTGPKLDIRVLQSAPGNPGVAALVGARDVNRLNTIKDEINTAAEAWKRIIEASGADVTITLRRMQNSVPLASSIGTDKGVFVTPYLFSLPTHESPSVLAPAGTAYHAAMQKEFETAWNEATGIARTGVVESVLPPQKTSPTPNAPPDQLLSPGATGFATIRNITSNGRSN